MIAKNNKAKLCSSCKELNLHCGTIVFCTDRRVNAEAVSNALKKQGFPEELVFCVKSSYGHESAGNKIHESDPLIAQALKLGIGPGHFGKIVSVFGHSSKCGGMNAQHELHKLEFLIEKEKLNKNKKKAKELKEKLNELKKDAISGWVALDLNEFKSLVSELKKKFLEKEFEEFLFSDDFRILLEEFNVFVQLKKLINRKDFQEYYFNAFKDGRGKIKLIAGIYSPKEKICRGAYCTSTGKVNFDFPFIYSVFGEKKVKEILSFFNLFHLKGKPEIEYKISYGKEGI